MSQSTKSTSELNSNVVAPAPRTSMARRAFIASAGLAGIGAMGFINSAFGAGTGGPDAGLTRRASRVRDFDILNFALNLEYLEAEFYQRAIGNPNSLAGNIDGAGTPGGVTGGTTVTFATPDIGAYAREIAADEKAHVLFLRTALGSARVARPAIDLQASFTAAAIAAGIIPAGATFDAFANENNFLLASFIFEDVGVTAYKGGAPLLLDPAILEAAAGLLAVEAYHAGIIRTLLYSRRDVVAVPASGGNPAVTVAQAVQKISDLRDTLDGPVEDDQGIVAGTEANVVPTDANGLAFSRTPRQVLNIVYAAPGAPVQGGFLPSGANGTIS